MILLQINVRTLWRFFSVLIKKCEHDTTRQQNKTRSVQPKIHHKPDFQISRVTVEKQWPVHHMSTTHFEFWIDVLKKPIANSYKHFFFYFSVNHIKINPSRDNLDEKFMDNLFQFRFLRCERQFKKKSSWRKEILRSDSESAVFESLSGHFCEIPIAKFIMAYYWK